MRRHVVHRIGLLAAAFTSVACGASRTPVPSRPLEVARSEALGDDSRLYHAMGRAATFAPIAFVGAAAYYAAESPDSTLTLFAISFPNRTLEFVRESDRYRAPYSVQIRVLRGGTEVTRVDALEIVRVGSFREIGRTDESVIFQRWLRLAPGTYVARMSVRDAGTGKAAADSLLLSVPRLTNGGVSTALPIYEARGRTRLDSIPAILPRPRSTAIFGRDSTVSVYVEAYGPGAAGLPVRVTVRSEAGLATWSDTALLPRRGSLFAGTVAIPVSPLGLGAATATITRTDAPDSSFTPLFVSFGDDLPVAPYEEMLSYLRYFASASRLRVLRDALPERRASIWAQFLRDTDPTPSTPEHEGLQAYFARIQIANARFREEGRHGWLSDRGMVYVSLGEPDQAYEQNVRSQRSIAQGYSRVQVWEYRQYRAQLVFVDELQLGRYKLTQASESEFRAINNRRLPN